MSKDNSIKVNDVFLHTVLGKHLVNEFNWGERRFPIVNLNFHIEIPKTELFPLLRAIIISKYGSLQNYTLYYHHSTITYITDDIISDSFYLSYSDEAKRTFSNSALPYLRPKVLIIDMTDVTETGIETHYSKYEWLNGYLHKHKKHSKIDTTVIVCTNNRLDADKKGFNLNDFLIDTADIVFNLKSLESTINEPLTVKNDK